MFYPDHDTVVMILGWPSHIFETPIMMNLDEIVAQAEAERDALKKQNKQKRNKAYQQKNKAALKAKRKIREMSKRKGSDEAGVNVIELLVEMSRERTERGRRLKDAHGSILEVHNTYVAKETDMDEIQTEQFEWIKANVETLSGNGGRRRMLPHGLCRIIIVSTLSISLTPFLSFYLH